MIKSLQNGKTTPPMAANFNRPTFNPHHLDKAIRFPAENPMSWMLTSQLDLEVELDYAEPL